jgi:hypothetical protein
MRTQNAGGYTHSQPVIHVTGKTHAWPVGFFELICRRGADWACGTQITATVVVMNQKNGFQGDCVLGTWPPTVRRLAVQFLVGWVPFEMKATDTNIGITHLTTRRHIPNYSSPQHHRISLELLCGAETPFGRASGDDSPHGCHQTLRQSSESCGRKQNPVIMKEGVTGRNRER